MNVLHTECSMNWGGQEYRTTLENEYLNENGHNSWIMCHEKSEFFKKANELNAKNIVKMNLSKSWRLDVAFKILFFCLKNKIDVINSHGSKDSLLSIICFLYGIPLVRSRQITNDIRKASSYKYLCTHIMAAAQAIKDMLIKKGVPKENVTVVGEGINLKEYNPHLDSIYLKEEYGIDENDNVIVNIGMIRDDKGQEYFLEAANELLKENKNYKFFILGEGTKERTLEKHLKSLIKKYNIENNFFMPGYRDDIANFTHLSDIVVVASIGTEAQSRIVPQAFATKRTVVSTNIGGLTELVDNETNGLVVNPKDSKSMARAIDRLINNKEFRDELANNGYEFALKNLSIETMMQKTLDLYTKLIK